MDPSVDIALAGLECPAEGIKAFYMNEHASIVEEVLVLGFPPIAGSTQPHLITHRGEVSAIVDQEYEMLPT